MKTVTVCKTLFAVFAAATLANAQSGLPCGTSHYDEQLKQLHPVEVQQAEQQLRQATDAALMNGPSRSTTTYSTSSTITASRIFPTRRCSTRWPSSTAITPS
jgi:hypothetical protein